MTALSIRQLTKRFSDRIILEQIDLDVDSNEFVCLFGASGSGKTTLLNLMAGLETADAGEITIESSPGREGRVGYVFQNPRLLPWRTVLENIVLSLPDGVPIQEAEALLKRVGLSEYRDQYPERLSLGMSRRVALVRAFAVNPDLLLMDEPLVSLDAPTARTIRALILDLWQQRPHTVLYVTHDLDEAIELGDRVVFLSASPAKVLYDTLIDIPRGSRTPDAIRAFKAHLVHQHPPLERLI